MTSFLNKKKKGNKISWHEKYLPFVSRSPEMQIKWLLSAFKKGILNREELVPYVRLLLSGDDIEKKTRLKELFRDLDKEALTALLVTADIYDTAKLFRLLPTADEIQAEIAISKHLPAYEKKTRKIIDDIFYAVNERPDRLLEAAARSLLAKGEAPSYFQSNYERFQEILHDEEFLLSIYPNAQK